MNRRLQKHPRSGAGLIVALLVAGIGLYFLTTSLAATSAVAVEAEQGSLGGVATVVNDTSASDGKAVMFGGSTRPDYDHMILGDAPVAYWAMTGSNTEADLSGNLHTGTYIGGMPSHKSLPNNEQAADFNGTNQYMTVASSAALSVSTTHQLSWEAWIQPDTLQFPKSTNGYVDWMGKCQSYSLTCEWEARMYDTTNSQARCNRLSAYVFNSGAGLGSAADWQPACDLLQPHQWLHVVGEYQTLTTPARCNAAYPGSVEIWVNGVKWNSSYHGTTGCMSQYSVTPTASNSPLNIGTMALDSWFAGSVGKVAIYDYQLTQAQINQHYSAMTGDQPSGSCANTCTK